MADSKLVTYENYTSHYDSRNGRKITKIFVHHMAGIMTVKDCGRVFKTREASAHYGIDATGAVGQYVHEKHRAWSVASAYYDSMAISIELANSTKGPTWKVSDTAIAKCIDLIVDICKRNGIKKINYTGDLSGNLCMHQWVISTACPGPYLKTKFSYIAQQVNKKLGASVKPNATIKAGQKWLGTEQDGIVSGQSYYDAEYIPALESCTEWGDGGSNFIRALQKKMNVSIRSGLDEDGYCGKKTVTALQTYLKKAGYSIEVDGYWGSKTMVAFGKYLANPKELKTELYYVRKTFADKSSQKGAFSVKQNAINLCNKYVGYHVYDSKGTLIHTSTKKDEGTAQKFLDELESMEVDMRKLGFKYSNTGSKLGSTWADAKKKKYINCATYTSWALQEIGVLAKGDLFYCKNHKVNNQRGNAVANLKKHASISYPNKTPKNCNLKAGDICGYTTHTQTFAGWDKNGNPLWYTMGSSDIGKNLPRVRSDYNTRKIEVLIRLK